MKIIAGWSWRGWTCSWDNQPSRGNEAPYGKCLWRWIHQRRRKSCWNHEAWSNGHGYNFSPFSVPVLSGGATLAPALHLLLFLLLPHLLLHLVHLLLHLRNLLLHLVRPLLHHASLLLHLIQGRLFLPFYSHISHFLSHFSHPQHSRMWKDERKRCKRRHFFRFWNFGFSLEWRMLCKAHLLMFPKIEYLKYLSCFICFNSSFNMLTCTNIWIKFCLKLH